MRTTLPLAGLLLAYFVSACAATTEETASEESDEIQASDDGRERPKTGTDIDDTSSNETLADVDIDDLQSNAMDDAPVRDEADLPTDAQRTLIAASARSIRGWAKCDGTTDDALGVANAFAAAKNDAFPIVVDCPVRIHVGNDITRPIFIDSGTTVTFSGNGKFIVDNIGIPAFVLANSHRVTLLNWIVQYDASLPITSNKTAGQFNDVTMKKWMAKNRRINYVGANPLWGGPTDLSAIFLVKGSSSVLTVDKMRLFVPSTATGNRFIPMCFGFIAGERDGTTIRRDSPYTKTLFTVPIGLLFTNIEIDGSYFGFQGNVQNTTFRHIRSHRYADLQDAQGKNVGGIGKWFAPPHLFYLNYLTTGDPALFNTNIGVYDTVDYGNRVGVARDRGGSDTISGYANSLKIGGVNVTVDQYTSFRPDGLMDVLPSNGLKISNVNATYNSVFLNNLFPGIRFPAAKYHNVAIKNVTLSDLAPTSTMNPLRGNNDASNTNISFTNTVLKLKAWKGTRAPDYSPTIAGTPVYFAGRGNNIKLTTIIGK